MAIKHHWGAGAAWSLQETFKQGFSSSRQHLHVVLVDRNKNLMNMFYWTLLCIAHRVVCYNHSSGPIDLQIHCWPTSQLLTYSSTADLQYSSTADLQLNCWSTAQLLTYCTAQLLTYCTVQLLTYSSTVDLQLNCWPTDQLLTYSSTADLQFNCLPTVQLLNPISLSLSNVNHVLKP